MKNPAFNNLMDSIKELHDKKNHDYATEDNPYSNFEVAALLVNLFTDSVDQVFAGRIGDKLARLGQLLSGKEPNFESVEDTMKDITTLCAIWTARYIDYKPKTTDSIPIEERPETKIDHYALTQEEYLEYMRLKKFREEITGLSLLRKEKLDNMYENWDKT